MYKALVVILKFHQAFSTTGPLLSELKFADGAGHDYTKGDEVDDAMWKFDEVLKVSSTKVERDGDVVHLLDQAGARIPGISCVVEVVEGQEVLTIKLA